MVNTEYITFDLWNISSYFSVIYTYIEANLNVYTISIQN